MSSKFHSSKWKTCFPQFIDEFLKIEQVEYLIHYVKFKMLSLECKFHLLSQNVRILVLGCTLFSPIYSEIEN